jgi:hypothetical protein
MTFYPMFDPSNLRAGDADLIAREITVAMGGSAPYPRGTLLGRAGDGSVSAAVKTGGNTASSGALTLDPTTPRLANAIPGIYTVRCIAAATDAGTFRVTDPDGRVLGDVVSALTAVTFADQIKFTVASVDGHDFVVGDGWNITVGGLDKYVPCVATAIDGSQIPAAVLAANTDATGGDAATVAYFSGEFAWEKMTVDASWTTAAGLDAAFRQAGLPIYVRSLGALG